MQINAQNTSFVLNNLFWQFPQGASGFYNIDNEEYEAMPVEVRLLPRKLRFFISAERRAQLLSLTQGEKDIKDVNSTETT